MAHWLNLGQNFKVNAKRFPDTLAVKDQNRSFTYRQTNERVNRLAGSLIDLGLKKGDKVAVLLENSIEIVEIFLATAKTGLIIVPINFRLVGREIEYIVNNSDAATIFVHEQFTGAVDQIRAELGNIAPERFFVVGAPAGGYREYETFIASGSPQEPACEVKPSDTWILIYTSGTTGKPKGVLRSHESHIAFYIINALDFGFTRDDICMNVMPLCHINSVFFTFTFLYLGGSVYIHPALSFKGEEVLEIIEREKITFISLIPTHYNLILNVTGKGRNRDVSSIRKLLCSSAPVRRKMKMDIMDFFKGVQLYEAYGSTEAGTVTVLRPEEQLNKLGSIGCECLGTDLVKILDGNGHEVQVGEIGEIFSRGPMLFDGYYKLPEKTAQSFRGEYFSAGDMGSKDEDGFFHIVDRRDNMIITGGENVYPSEVEEVIGGHESVFDCACIGVPDEKWGEKVVAVVVCRPGIAEDQLGEAIKALCKTDLARFKRPKEIIFVKNEEMPRTSTGKILHRKLREMCGSGKLPQAL
ncbi:AMP-dependent synthetase and ligase [Syntrophobacter sp. SbD2]|nr:AMP-dependent synthetase and ligase [Syntrophobacter sp. SbD2]